MGMKINAVARSGVEKSKKSICGNGEDLDLPDRDEIVEGEIGWFAFARHLWRRRANAKRFFGGRHPG